MEKEMFSNFLGKIQALVPEERIRQVKIALKKELFWDPEQAVAFLQTYSVEFSFLTPTYPVEQLYTKEELLMEYAKQCLIQSGLDPDALSEENLICICQEKKKSNAEYELELVRQKYRM